MAKPKDDGHVKALISWNYNNLECSRPLPPDATDEDYRREFEKAVQLTEEAVRNLERLKEEQRHFYALCDEFLYLNKTNDKILKRVADGGTPRNDAEDALLARLLMMQQFCFEEHTPTWKWEQRLYDSLAEELDDGNEPSF